MPTPTVENYLKVLYTLRRASGAALVPMGDLARALGVAPGTATLMIQRLAQRGLVDYAPRAGAKLSRKGKRQALDVLRRHRLIELFLVEVVGLDWSQVHDEAEELEHAISDRLLERIDDMLGNPAFDPHGDPIPQASGKITARRLIGLDAAAPGPATVARITDDSPDFLRFVDQHGLTPSAAVTVAAHDPVGQTVTLEQPGGGSVQLGHGAAAKILVEAG